MPRIEPLSPPYDSRTAAHLAAMTPPGVERLMIRAADELHDRSGISDELWDELAVHFDQAQLLDIVLLCGWYHAISFIATAARVALEPGAPRFVTQRRDGRAVRLEQARRAA